VKTFDAIFGANGAMKRKGCYIYRLLIFSYYFIFLYFNVIIILAVFNISSLMMVTFIIKNELSR